MTAKTPTKPSRRFYATGEGLPELTQSFRPISLGRDSNDDPDGQIRAFAVSVRNKSDNTVYIKESTDSDPVPIDRFGTYDIWENNGVSRIELKGAEGGERVEVRTLEAHNDFSIRDRIDAFVRAISHFLSQNKQETVITDSETVISTDIQDSQVTFDTVLEDISEGVTVDTNIQSSDIELDTSIQSVSGDANFNTTITQSDIDLPVTGDVTVSGAVDVDTLKSITDTVEVSGDVDVDTLKSITETVEISGAVDVNTITTISDTITIDDITATSATFDGDITGQANFDIDARNRSGQELERRVRDTAPFAENIDLVGWVGVRQDWLLYDSAPFDGQIQRIAYRVYEDSEYQNVDHIGFNIQIDTGDGFDEVSPQFLQSPLSARRWARQSQEVTINSYSAESEVVMTYEPQTPLTFRAGDSVRVRFRTDETAPWVTDNQWQTNDEFSVEATVMLERKTKDEV